LKGYKLKNKITCGLSSQ